MPLPELSLCTWHDIGLKVHCAQAGPGSSPMTPACHLFWEGHPVPNATGLPRVTMCMGTLESYLQPAPPSTQDRPLWKETFYLGWGLGIG